MIKNCLVRKDSRKDRNKNKPWISKGSHNACKKNTLYKERVQHRTKETENKYKYKNKLTSIMRIHKKQYYITLLHYSQCCEMLRSLAWAIPTSGAELFFNNDRC